VIFASRALRRRHGRLGTTIKILKIFSQKDEVRDEVRILIFFKTFKDIDLV